jgi:hypothetical protein
VGLLSLLSPAGCGEPEGDGAGAGDHGATEAPASPTYFAPDSFWNASLADDAAIDPNSRAMVDGLVREVESELARGYGPWINTEQYSTPIYTVAADQPTVHVSLDRDLPTMQGAIDAVPIPPSAEPAAGTDRHLVVWQPATDTMWEFWNLDRQPDGWHTDAAGAMRRVSTNPGYYTSDAWPGAEPWWGATATGLPLLGGLITLDELERGRIDHALAMAIPHARAGVWSQPATHGDGDSADPDSLPEGAHLRLDPALDLDRLDLPPLTEMVAEAAQRYGIVIRDRAGVVALYGEDPTPSGADTWSETYRSQGEPDRLLSRFPWRELQVLTLDLQGPSAEGRSSESAGG